MATRLKTVQFAFPALASLTNNTLTNLTQITLYLPESSKTFRSAILKVTCDDIITATGGSITTKTVNFRVGAAGYTTVANANTMTNSGENLSLLLCQDFAGHLTTNWTGTSMTADVQLQINQSTGTTLNMVNVCATLEITYEYDDTSATQVKTVYLPLDWPVAALGTTKPGTQNATIPALDTHLPENGKTIRSLHIVMQGNIQANASTTDSTLSAQIDSLTALTTGNHEQALASNRFMRYVWDISGLGMTTNATHGFYVWGSVARYNHWQAWLVVTYEFTLSGTTTALNSTRLALKSNAVYIGGTTSADYVRLTATLWIEEPTTITGKEIAAFLFWEANGNIAGLNARVGTGTFVAYTDNMPASPSGGNAMMVRNDAAITLARGKNEIVVDVYRTDATDIGAGIAGYLIVNYHSGIASGGIGSHNHTVNWPLAVTSTGAAANGRTVTVQPLLPEADFWINSIGAELAGHIDGTGTQGGLVLVADRDSDTEGFQSWETISRFRTITYNGAEVGVRIYVDDCTDLFEQFPGDARLPTRMDIETSRVWQARFGQGGNGWVHYMGLFITYHSITFTAADSVSGFSGTVTIELLDGTTREKVKSTTRSGDGAFSITWYDSTVPMEVKASDGTNKGVSSPTLCS